MTQVKLHSRRNGYKLTKIHTDTFYEAKEIELASGWTEHLDCDAILAILAKSRNNGTSRNGKDKVILPVPYKAACHLCKKTQYFLTIDECTNHIRDIHRVWKG